VTNQLPGKLVGISDYRDARLLAPDIADRMVMSFKTTNPRVDRAAILMGDGGVITLQAERIVREADNPQRRIFRSAPDAIAWLSEVLAPMEIARLKHFLDEK
jgi:hypothetical protein